MLSLVGDDGAGGAEGGDRGDVFGPVSSLPRRSLMPGVVLILGFTSILILIASSRLGRQEIRRHEMLERCVDRFELELAHSHLWLEEYLTGDTDVDLQTDVWQHLDEARNTSNALRYGGTVLGEAVRPPSDPALTWLATSLNEDLGRFRDLSMERFGAGAGVGSAHDQAYDKAFRSLLTAAQEYREAVDQRLGTVRLQTSRWQGAVIGVWSAIVLVAVIGLYTRERRHRAALATIQRNRRWLAATLSSIGEGVVTTDLVGRVTYMNPVAEDMTGHNRDDALGHPIEGVVRLRRETPEGEHPEQPVASILKGGQRSVSDRHRILIRKDLERLPVDTLASPILGDDGELRGAVLVFRDASRRLQAEADLQSREAELLQSQKLEAVGRLAGGIAHDVSNYLGAIRGYCEVAVMKNESGEALKRRMGSAIDTCHKVSALIRQLLAFSRRQPMAREVVDLNRLVGDFEALTSRLLGEDLTIETLSERGPHHILADPAQIEQALINLLVNARDALPDGGDISIRLSSREVSADDKDLPEDVTPGRFVLLSVSDTGPGIPQKLRNKIFEPFFSTKEGDHSGLGLATVYGVVRQNDGFLNLQSAPDQGATFELFFPATEQSPSLPRHSVESKGSECAYRILLVEDSDPMRESTHDMLSAMGHSVTSVGHPEEALEQFDSDKIFDLVITDVVMPGMSGKDLADRLKRRPEPPPVLFISGYTDRIHLHHDPSDRNGAPVFFLQKPFGAVDLGERIRRLMAPATAGSEERRL